MQRDGTPLDKMPKNLSEWTNDFVLRPHLQQVTDEEGTRCFRIMSANQFGQGPSTSAAAGEPSGEPQGQFKMADIEEPVPHPYLADDSYEEFKIQYLEKEKFFVAYLNIPRGAHGYLLGPYKAHRGKLEKETGTKIRFPPINDSGPIEVKGRIRNHVGRACRTLALKADDFRSQARPTHFISMSVVNKDILAGFERFKFKVTTMAKLGPDIFQSNQKLHQTLCMLTLLDDREVQKASELLDKFVKEEAKKLLDSSKINMQLKGVDIMSDDPLDAKVLYARVAGEAAKAQIMALGNRLIEIMDEQGLATKKEIMTVKLHVTLMNTKFRVTRARRQLEFNTFNATHILTEMKDYDFGFVDCHALDLCEVGSTGKDGAHKRVSRHNFVA